MENENALITGEFRIGDGVRMGVLAFDRHGTQTTPELCVRHGGHCWARNTVQPLAANGRTDEHCRHCTATRSGVPREAMAWTYPEGQA